MAVVTEPYFVSDLLPIRIVQFGAQTGGNRTGSDTARLGVADQTTHPEPDIQADFG